MKYTTWKFFVLIFILYSCCRDKSIETARFQLSPEELELIPYTAGQKISFIHSNGYTFNFDVVEDILEWKTYQDFCEWNCCGLDYFSYQVRTTTLKSEYPRFTISLSLGGSRFGTYNPKMLIMDINNMHFLALHYDSSAHFICDGFTETISYDSIVVNNKVFTDVVEKSFDDHAFIKDSTILVPKSILYNKLGLLRIKMSNNETYSINN